MKKILLIGDSIRLGYDALVKEAYRNQAEVYFPNDNCRFAAYTLRHLHDWKNDMQCGDDIDCVHWNVGLWDTLSLYGDEPLTPPDVYGSYIERICKRISVLFPNAKVIFATSTPVNEALFENPEVSFRRNSDTEAYNAIAVEIVKKYGHEINDLYTLMDSLPIELHSDAAHYYTRDGAKIVSDRVLSVIDNCLGIKSESIDFDKWFLDTDCYEGGAWLKKRANELNTMSVTLGT